MSNKKVRQPYMDEQWFINMLKEVDSSSKTDIAKKLGFARPSFSLVCNGSGPYGDGRASTKNIELAYRREYEQLVCPHTKGQVGIAHCRETALRAAPTHNPLQMMQWQACQQCSYKPSAAKAEPPVPFISSKYAEPFQQAGIIDKVTLPLPEVGAPQIEEIAKEKI